MLARLSTLFYSSKPKLIVKPEKKNKLFAPGSGIISLGAILADDVYEDRPIDYIVGDTGWTLFDNSSGIINALDSFKAATYVFIEAGQVRQVAFVFRGTVLGIETLVSDLEIALKEMPTQFTNVRRYMQSVIGKMYQTPMFNSLLNDEDWRDNVYFFGHSLGGVLSEFAASLLTVCPEEYGKFGKDFQEYGVCATFENPGSSNAIKFFLITEKNFSPNDVEKALDMIGGMTCSYQSSPNIINTCNPQTGTVATRLTFDTSTAYDYTPLATSGEKPNNSTPSLYKFPQPIVVPQFWLNPYFLLSWTIFHHGMDHLRDYILYDKNQQFGYMNPSSWPVGSKETYIYYTNTDMGFYKLDNRANAAGNYWYWYGYFYWCWENYPNERKTKNWPDDIPEDDRRASYINGKIHDMLVLHTKLKNESSLTQCFSLLFNQPKLVHITQDKNIHEFVYVEKDTPTPMSKH